MVELMSLGDICYISDYVSNGSFASLRENVHYKSEPDYAVLLRVVDYSCGFDKSKFVYIDEHAYNFLSKSSLEGGEIIMSNVGSCGLLFRCPKLDKKMSLAPNAILIKSKYIDYLFYWLGSKFGQEEIKKITSKSAMPKFNKTEFKKIRVPIPSLSEQNRIVRILDTFTSSIDNLKQQIAERRKQYDYYLDKLFDLDENDKFEKKKLKDLLEFEQPTRYLVKTTEYDNAFKTPVLTAGQSLLLGYTDETEGIYYANKNNPTIIFDDFTTSFHWIDFDFKVKSSAMKMLRPFKGINFKYVFYAMKNIHFVPGSHQRHWISIFSHFEINYPPSEYQSEIVSILDTFIYSIQNLEAQLKLREKQYEYYRNKLLTFE